LNTKLVKQKEKRWQKWKETMGDTSHSDLHIEIKKGQEL